MWSASSQPQGHDALGAASRSSSCGSRQTHRIAVLEDNPYGELRFRGEAPSAARGARRRVASCIHLGTFSKTLAPGLRLGWLVGAQEVVRAATIAKQAADLHTGTLSQRAAAMLLARFDYDGHLATAPPGLRRAMRRHARRAQRHMPPGTRWTRPDGGLFIWAELPEGLSADELFADALREKVAFVPGSAFFAEAPRTRFLRLNYCNRPADLIEEGIARLGKVIQMPSGWIDDSVPWSSASGKAGVPPISLDEMLARVHRIQQPEHVAKSTCKSCA